ncbi:MAG: Glycosyl transferase, family 4, conserved region [Candidatus Curtissbacteria bacterium GW2011_GWA1_41_11]|uniref:Glycosyl transferase, family 4, conserved region n=1 Tax=Candidatus Curtissbacteria bacterium GW2011_GWA1_41_11 TaxID=1618409 RepID=A0A0G0UAK4_9BACT|nr:MAG: Glycosyl transferase, family 4, conserved region [Candidatus Curtissbacteria bacterium GW2011_GWA1_41_11]
MSLFASFLLATFLSLIFVPTAIILAKKFGLVDDPKKRKHPAVIHTKSIPRAGGLPIFLAFLTAAVFAVPLSPKLIGIFLGGAVLVLVGLIDDKYDLPATWKFIAQIIAALIAISSGVGIAFITNPFNLIGGLGVLSTEVIRLDSVRIAFNFFGNHSILIWADLFALFWIVWVVNMINFSAGVDGQMPGIALVTFLVIFIASLRFFYDDPNQQLSAAISLIAAGVTLGFLFYNFNPAKIFPGDSASYFLGFLIATLAIISGAKVGTAILVTAVPLVDGVFTVTRRLVSKKSPFKGDKLHLHHRLLEIGLSQRQVALFYWLLCAILGAVALSLDSQGKLFAGLLIAVILIGGLTWLNMTLPQKDQK